MKQFKARFTVERELVINAADAADAARFLEGEIKLLNRARLLDVIPVDQEWPDTIQERRPPPRSTPPSGSPGTPTLEAQPELAQVVAA